MTHTERSKLASRPCRAEHMTFGGRCLNCGFGESGANLAGYYHSDEWINAAVRGERRIADKIDGYDRDDLGESPDY